MRIVLDGTPLLYGGGVSRVCGRLLESLSSVRPDLDLRLYIRKAGRISKQSGLKDIRRLHFPLPRAAEPVIQRFGLIEKLSRADLSHATDHYLPVGDPSRCVVTVHDLIFLTDPQRGWETHSYFPRVVPKLIESCGAIISCSEETKKVMVDRLNTDPDKIHVIPWGLDHDLFKLSENPEITARNLRENLNVEEPYFLSVGCASVRKNPRRILQAFSQLNTSQVSPSLIMLWDAPKEVREKYKSMNVHFLTHISDALLVDLYRQATALVYPSLSEGFGLPILEAMACGAPVITSKVSSMPEVGGDAALYVDPTSTEEIQEQMQKLLDDQSLCQRLVAKGLVRAQAYTWEACAQATVKVYERVNERVS